MLTLPTLYQIEKTEKFEDFRRSTSVEVASKKNGKGKIKTNVLVPKTNSMRKEEGATVSATPTFPHSGQLRAFVGPF